MVTEKEFKERGFDELARYNRRVIDGIMHTKEYVKRMKDLQKDYDKWIKEKEKPIKCL